MSSSGEIIEVWCVTVKTKSGVVSSSEFSNESSGDRWCELISWAVLNGDIVICGLTERVLFCSINFSKWGTTG